MSEEKPPPAPKPKKEKLAAEDQPLDLAPDAWERFERAVDQVAKSPPQHRTKIRGDGSLTEKPSKEGR
jgi:hypothetical protein